MNIMKLFRGNTMTATAEQPTEAELQRQLAEVEIQLAAGDGDIFEMGEEKEVLKRKILAKAHERQQRENVEHRARNKARLADFLKRRDTTMTKVNAHVTGLIFALGDMQKLVDECNVGVPFEESTDMAALFGVPPDFAQIVRAAIRDAAPLTDWAYEATDPFDPKPGRPKLGPGPTIHFAPDRRPPIGFSGAWNTIMGRPMEPGDVGY